jgi:sugar-phosphatase
MRGVLLDVDGVLLDTGDLFHRVWREWATVRSLDPAWVIAQTYGSRTEDTLRLVAPHLDPTAERRALDALTKARLDEVRPVPGTAALLRSLRHTPWAIVTSGSAWFVREGFQANRLPLPAVAVYDTDVRRGKPAPDGYLAAASRLALAPADCLVVEDAPRGIAAAKAAGCTVIAVATTHPPAQLGDADACVATLAEATGLVTAWTQTREENRYG